jgi:hypothetical protein
MLLTDLSDIVFNTGCETEAMIAGKAVMGIFRTKFQNVKLYGVDLAASKDTFQCRASDVNGLAQDAPVLINNVTYFLNVAEPQDEFRALLILSTEKVRR